MTIDSSEAVYDELKEQVVRASKNVSRLWSGIIEADDLEQRLWEHILTRPSTVQVLMDARGDDRYGQLARLAHREAGRERADYEVFSGQFHYSVDEVKGSLGRILTQPGEITAEVMDVMDGLEALSSKNSRHLDLILRRYADGEVLESGADRKALTRALESLTELVNTVHKRNSADHRMSGGPGARTEDLTIEPKDN
ncbi:DNA binding protein [Rhodococcus phage AppleCloud]|uniref:DNA binding protein n=1 Tax=Rhodococcus phage AppleCloud TaxID=2015827 RepID=A0A223FZN2_9CAUD|nr:DNA binding protein [Rhodococcus phage AppleCloud]